MNKETISVEFRHKKRNYFKSFAVNGTYPLHGVKTFKKIQKEAVGFIKLKDSESVIQMCTRIKETVDGDLDYKLKLAFLTGWVFMRTSKGYAKSMYRQIGKLRRYCKRLSMMVEVIYDCAKADIEEGAPVAHLVAAHAMGSIFFAKTHPEENKSCDKDSLDKDCNDCGKKDDCPVHKLIKDFKVN